MTTFKVLLNSAAALFIAGLFCSLAPATSASAASPFSGFGVQSFEVSATNEPTPEQLAKGEQGSPDVQAGSHPYALTTSFAMNELEERDGKLVSPEGFKTVSVALPPGFVGNPNAVPRCSYRDFQTPNTVGDPSCPADTAIGWARVEIYQRNVTYVGKKTHRLTDNSFSVTTPLYNIEPAGGVPAQFGFSAVKVQPVLIDASVRTGSDYGITETSPNNVEANVIMAAKISVWGVPADPSHDRFRGECLGEASYYEAEEEAIEEATGRPPNPEVSALEEEEHTAGAPRRAPAKCPVDIPVEPLLTNPTSCGEPREVKFSIDGWNEPAVFDSKTVSLPVLQGCEKLDFSPTLAVQPDGGAGSTPTGLNVAVHVNQESTSNPVGLGEADVKNTTVALPPGVQISPSASDGLEACSGDPADPPGTPGNEIGFTGFKELAPVSEPGVQSPQYTPRLPGSMTAMQAGETAPLEPGKNFCPDASKIANVKIKTPLLEGELTGAVYLAAPQNFTFMGAPEENPFKSLIAMYLVAEEPTTGVLVKLPGEVSLNHETGQITTTFRNTPQTPFSDLQLEFYGTERAPLATPALCGTYDSESSFVPWSGTATVHAPASFAINSGPELETSSGPQTAPCPNPPGDDSLSTLPFKPTLSSGATNINAGSFTPLTTTLGREDGQQQIQQVTLRYPPGLSGILTGVKLCGETEANEGTCGPESEIGETTVSVGLGGDPFSVVGGKVYLTGPYDGAPFGLSIVNPAKAGPFVLQEGRPVVVRAKIEINPTTAALTITTNTAGQGHAIPSMIEGIPLQIKHVNVNITRSGFTFNPTSCDPTQITGTIASAEGASSPVSIPFQVTNCASLKYTPKVSFSTNGNTSKENGASLTTKVTYPSAPQGTYANVGYVKVELPKALPSRLSTLQKGCLAKVFEANPAACPSESKIGYAVVHTPLLPVPLEGPAIFVSHGGEEFPSLTIVLQGYGVTIDLVGSTFISKAGITSTTFKTVPDTPFSTFELVLPQGPYSALTAYGNLCTQKLVIPNEWVGANGALLRQDSTLNVEGCPAVIAVVGHRVKGKTATIQVKVPSAGKLVASGKGLSKASKQATGASTVTVKLTLSSGEAAALSKHKGRKLKAKIDLTFTPKSGAKLKTSTTVIVG